MRQPRVGGVRRQGGRRQASKRSLTSLPQEFDALADERAHLEAGLSAAKDEILGLKAEREAPWRGAGGAGGGGGGGEAGGRA